MLEKSLIEDFLKREKDAGFTGLLGIFNKENRLFMTSEIAYDWEGPNADGQTIIKPSVRKQLSVTPFILLGFLFIFFYIKLIIVAPVQGKFLVAFLLLMPLSIVCLAIYFVFIDKKRNFRIIIDKYGISASDKKFSWAQVRETFILIKPGLRGSPHYLVIANTENVFFKFNLEGLGVTHEKLASIIEYYKMNQDSQDLND